MPYRHYKTKILACLCFSVQFFQAAFADTNAYDDAFDNFIKNTVINGDIRNYYFSRDYTNPDASNQAAYSLGGNLRILTAPILGGFQLGAGIYTAQDLGMDNNNPKKVDQSLPGVPVTVLGQAYLQYQNSRILIRGGDQLINTPWMNAADSRMIPATYRGIYGSWSPQENMSFIALRIFDFKSRISDSFSATNLYTPDNSGTPIHGLAGDTFAGAQAVGATYKTGAINSQLWGYQFFDFGKLLYADAQYTFAQSANLHPFIGIQGLKEWGDGNDILQQVSSDAADATAFGAQIGLDNPRVRFTTSYNKIFQANGAYNNGDIVSPYTSGYASDPLYTTSMLAGLVEKSSGDAVKIAATVFAFDKQIQFTTSFARYFTAPNTPNTNETDFDLTYTFPKSSRFKGLSIRNRFGILTGNTSLGTFYANRLMLQYSF